MTITIELRPEEERVLRERARRDGRDLTGYVRQVLEEHIQAVERGPIRKDGADTSGVAWEDLVDRILARIDRLPDAMKSSMLQDLEGGRRLELAWLSGTIARMGRDLGIATPVHALIATALKLHAQGRG